MRPLAAAGIICAMAFGVSVTAAADAGPPAEPAPAPSARTVPPGHPPVQDDDDDAADPHAGGGHGGIPGMPGEGPADGAREDDTLPVGTIEAQIVDANGKPLPKAPVTLGILQNSVAKGESRRRLFQEANESGVVRFAGLEAGSGYAYRVSVSRDMATFAITPFQLPAAKGMRAKLHVFPVTSDIAQAQVGAQAIVYVELKDDRVQVQQVLTVINLGRSAWVPQGVVMKLPAGFSALNGTQQMSDTGIDPIEKTGARLRGTFGPGKHVVEYRWQLPYGGEREVDIDLELMPRVVVARVLAPASQQMKLAVDGFPAAEPMVDPQGQRILQTERALMRREDPEIRRIHVTLRDLPTPGPARMLVTAAASLLAFGAIAWAVQTKRREGDGGKGAGKGERARLLEELEDLERARRSGEVGPKTYERARRELIDAIARTLHRPSAKTT